MSAPRLLIAYDGSPAARSAVRAAAALFSGARAVVASAHHEPASLEQAAAAARIGVPDEAIVGGVQALARAEARAAEVTAAEGTAIAADAGLAAEARTTDAGASAWRAIRRLAAESGADVVVCGSRGLGPFSRAALGSTSSGLLHHADRPVLVVPAGGGDLTGPIVIGYDGSDGAHTAIAAAARLLGDRQAIVVTVWEPPVLSHVLVVPIAANSGPGSGVAADDAAPRRS
jgi:nucleotide-binding universal stress UspA family protein